MVEKEAPCRTDRWVDEEGEPRVGDGWTDLPEPVLASALVPAEDPRVAAAGVVLGVGTHGLAGGTAGGGRGQAVVRAPLDRRAPELKPLDTPAAISIGPHRGRR